YKEVHGEKHPSYATNLNNLAGLYRDRGEHHKALPLYQQALRIYQQVLGEKHPDCATSLGNLAALYQEMGKQGAFVVLAGQALAIPRPHVRAGLTALPDRQRQQFLQEEGYRLEVFLSGALGTVPAPVLYEQVAVFKDVTSVGIAEQRLARQQPTPNLLRLLD